MPPVRRFFAFGLWLGVTATATVIVWIGTSSVAAELTDRPAPVVAHNDVVSALESGTTGAETAPGITTPEAKAATPPAPSDDSGVAAGVPEVPREQPSATGGPSPEAATEAPPVAPPVTVPDTQATTLPPARPTATYSTAGGVVTVACNNGYFIEVVSATPANDFTTKVANGGPYYIEVHFVRIGRDEQVWAFCLRGTPIRAYSGFGIPGR